MRLESKHTYNFLKKMSLHKRLKIESTEIEMATRQSRLPWNIGTLLFSQSFFFNILFIPYWLLIYTQKKKFFVLSLIVVLIKRLCLCENIFQLCQHSIFWTLWYDSFFYWFCWWYFGRDLMSFDNFWHVNCCYWSTWSIATVALEKIC